MSVYGDERKDMMNPKFIREENFGCPSRNSCDDFRLPEVKSKEEKNIFSELLGKMSESDSLLLMIILCLLLRDGGDKKLILALAYILL